MQSKKSKRLNKSLWTFNNLKRSKRGLRKVQLGSGSNGSDNYINMDFDKNPGVDIVQDLRRKLPFPDNSIEEFYSHHVLEHFNYPELDSLLAEVFRCLKPGGKLISRIPDFEHSAKQFLKLPPGSKRDNMMICMYGGNAFGWEPRESHIHCFGWTKNTIREKLNKNNFFVERCESVDSSSHIPVIDFTAIKYTYRGVGNMWGERTVEVPWMLNKIKGKSCIDIGSAESCYVNELLGKGIDNLVLNDIRKFETHKGDSRVTCSVSDIRLKSPKDLGKFDNVLCISTLEHIALTAYGQNREVGLHNSAYYPQREAFAHMMKFLKEGGQAILTVPYGRFEDSGWVIVYDEGMIRELVAPYQVLEETYFTLVDRENDKWKKVFKSQCPLKGMDSYNGGMRANSVCCLILKNK